MTLTERIAQTQQLINENPNALAVTIPLHTLQLLLAASQESLETRAKANYYEEQFLRTRIQNTRLKAEVMAYGADPFVVAGHIEYSLEA